MKQSKSIVANILLVITLALFAFFVTKQTDDSQFVTYKVNTKKQNVELFWKDDKDEKFKSIQNLKSWLYKNKRKLVFAMNAGMYKSDNSPLGLFIEKKITKSPLNTSNGKGNFYLKPNGVFCIATENTPFICSTSDFKNNGKIKYATQSGPMLVINGEIHNAFKEGSTNLNIRNGVGILPDGNVIFAMSKTEINFYDFAKYFKNLGCKNALYLDGFVSRTYLPEKNWIQTDENFGVIAGVTANMTE